MSTKPIWKDKVIKVPYCPKCGTELEKVTDPGAKTIMNWQCPKCFWCY